MATAERSATRLQRDFAALRRDFPALQQLVHGKPLAYLDNAASSQSPTAVHEAMALQQRLHHSNVHRGVHQLSERSTAAYEGAREKVRRFINAVVDGGDRFHARHDGVDQPGRRELRPATPSRATKCSSRGSSTTRTSSPGSCSANAPARGSSSAPIRDDGSLDVAAFEQRLNERTKIVALAHVSNALGTLNPVAELVAKAHAAGAVVLVDGAQAVPHLRVDVQALGLRLLRILGPQDVRADGHRRSVRQTRAARDHAALSRRRRHDSDGQLRAQHLQRPTLQVRGRHAEHHGRRRARRRRRLSREHRFRGRRRARARAARARDASACSRRSPARASIGTAARKASVLSFVVDGIHAHDLGTIVDREGVAIRTGHHCAMPVMERFGVAATARASFAFYNNHDDVDRLIAGLERAVEIFRG